MSAIVRNEFRLIRTSWLAAIIAAVVPIWITGRYYFTDWTRRFIQDDGVFDRTLMVLVIAAVLVSVATFGSEVSCGTFASLLSQPRARWEIWQTKIMVLFVAIITIALANYVSAWGWLSVVRYVHGASFVQGLGFLDSIWRDYERALVPLMIIAFVSGLWATIWLRQMATSLWVALAVPLVLYEICDAMVSPWMGVNPVGIEFVVALGMTAMAYVPAAYFVGRWMFMRAEVKQSQAQAEAFSISLLPSLARPVSHWRALFIKEIRLQQSAFVIAGGVLFLHLVSVVLPKYLPHPSPALRNASSVVWAIWLLLPPLVGGVAIAEERRCGTLDGFLCLPVKRNAAFVVKLIVVFGLAIFLGVILPYLVLTFCGDTEFLRGGNYPWSIVMVTLVLTALGLYASSLANSLLHALGCGVVAGFVILPFWFWAVGNPKWMPIIGSFVYLMVLTYHNSKQTRVTTSLYVVNCLHVIGAVVLAGAIGSCFSYF